MDIPRESVASRRRVRRILFGASTLVVIAEQATLTGGRLFQNVRIELPVQIRSEMLSHLPPAIVHL